MFLKKKNLMIFSLYIYGPQLQSTDYGGHAICAFILSACLHCFVR